jgi:hypothetical protein
MKTIRSLWILPLALTSAVALAQGGYMIPPQVDPGAVLSGDMHNRDAEARERWIREDQEHRREESPRNEAPPVPRECRFRIFGRCLGGK